VSERDSTRQATRRRLRRMADGSVLEAFGLSRGGCSAHPSPRATAVRRARAPSQGGGAPGLTAFGPNRSGGEARAEVLHLTAAEVDSTGRDDFAIVAANHGGHGQTTRPRASELKRAGIARRSGFGTPR
jgi:hypothetical protein